MKIRICISLLILASLKGYSQQLDCERFKTGTFLVEDSTMPQIQTVIKRHGKFQTEIAQIEGKKQKSRYIIQWSDDCSYTLLPTRKTYKLHPELPANARLTVRIVSADPSSYLQESTANFSDFKYRSIIRKR